MKMLPKYSPYVLNTFECGCQIQSEFTGGMGAKVIEYCPLHAAASEMYKALSGVLRTYEAYHFADHDPRLLKVKNALAKAEGKK